MQHKQYTEATIDALINELEILIDLEIEEASKNKDFAEVKLSELPTIDVYINIIKLLKQIKKN